jgi:hypothetical protein
MPGGTFSSDIRSFGAMAAIPLLATHATTEQIFMLKTILSSIQG